MKTLPAYLCESHAQWFVIRCPNHKIARREAISDFGRHVKSVRRATKQEVLNYRASHGAKEEITKE